MKIKRDIILRVERYNRTGHDRSIFSVADIASWIGYQVRKHGNIKNRDGCVYGVSCDDEVTRIKAEQVLAEYMRTPIEGWYKPAKANNDAQ